MAPTPKIVQTGAMLLEYGQTGVNQSTGFGDTSNARVLGATHAFPYLSFGNKVGIEKQEDESVTTKAFKSTSRMIGQKIDNPISFYGRFSGLDSFHYWMWGFEGEVMPVVAFKAGAAPMSAQPTPGDDVTDVDTQDFTFLRTETIRGDKIYIFRADEATPVAPTLQTGVLTSAAPAWTFTFTSHSGLMYEHTYELDGLGRRFRDYTTAEIAAVTGADATDKKNLMATFGKRFDTYDVRYANAVCKSFSMKLVAAGQLSWDCGIVGYKEERSDYSSDNWTLPTGLGDNSLVPAHFEAMFNIGTAALTFATDGSVSNLTELGVTESELAVDMPLQLIQDTVSGLYIAEPILEGKYGTRLTGTISRHTANTYQGYRDAQTPVIAQQVCNQGWYMQEIVIKEATLDEAGPDDGAVAAEPLGMDIGFVEGSHDWDDWFYGYTETQDSPVIFRTRNASADNMMVEY